MEVDIISKYFLYDHFRFELKMLAKWKLLKIFVFYGDGKEKMAKGTITCTT